VLPNVVVDKTLDVHLDKVHFDHLMIEGNLEIKSGKVNDIDIMALNASAIRLDTEQLIEGSIVFKQVCFIVYPNKNMISLIRSFRYRVSLLKSFSKLKPSTGSISRIS
jgi:hypothetical protein